MKKPSNKQAKKASKLAKAENLKKKANKFITVKNAEGAPDTTAEIVIKNKIDYEPKVSVIIPVYNVEEYLCECLDSVINQTLKEIEIICVDDGSIDSSLEILKEYAKKDNRITVMKQENLHAGVARNAGLAVAKGEYVAFMDADDLYPNEKTLQQLYNKVIEENVLICGGSLAYFKDKKVQKASNHQMIFSENKKMIFEDYQFIYGYTRYIYNLSFINKHKILFNSCKRYEDPIFCLKCLHIAKEFYCLKENTYLYRINPKPKEDFDKCYCDIAIAIQEILKYAFSNNLTLVYNEMFNRLHSKSMAWVFEGNKINEKDYLDFFGPRVVSDNELNDIVNKIFSHNILLSLHLGREYFKYLSNIPNSVEDFLHKTQKSDYIFIHGSGLWYPQAETIQYAIKNNIPVIKMEDGFLRSADTWCNYKVDKKYTTGISFTFTNDVFYFDATQSSFMERQINNSNFKLTKKQIQRAKTCIKKIIDNYLTKYNHQPIVTPNIGRNGVTKILVVDQSYGDFSIQKGLANDDTFKEMLEAAVRENPNADIIVKTHPDAIAPGTKRPLGYYSTLEDHDNIYIIREPINPIALLKYVDKVYVCTTQFGFEALMCGKEVHTFGMPFYAGWGLTIDAQKCSRRTAKRTLEEIFYIAYIKNTLYVDPVNKQRCSIERAIDYLIELRNEYKLYLKDKNSINNVKASVIIPVYNNEKYLKECLNSAINQTLKEIEIICINDGSTDNSLRILKSYARQDRRIIIINQKNQGQGSARNNAIKIAKGEYLVFLDSDDYLKEDALEIIYNKMKKNNLDMLSYSGYNFKDGCNEKEINPYWEYSYIPENFNLNRFNYKDCLDFIHQLNVSACTTAYKRWFIESNNIYFPEKVYYEDNVFFTKAITQAVYCSITKDKLYYRRIHSSSVTQNNNKNYGDYLKVCDILLLYMKNFDDKLYSQYEYSYLMRCFYFYNSFNLKEQEKYKNEMFKLLKKYNFNIDNNIVVSKVEHQEKNKTIVSKKCFLKLYLLLPYYLLKIRYMKRKLGKLPPSRLFSITKYGNKKVYRILGVKLAFNNFKKDVIDNQEKILKMLSDIQTRQKKIEKEINELKN